MTELVFDTEKAGQNGPLDTKSLTNGPDVNPDAVSGVGPLKLTLALEDASVDRYCQYK